MSKNRSLEVKFLRSRTQRIEAGKAEGSKFQRRVDKIALAELAAGKDARRIEEPKCAEVPVRWVHVDLNKNKIPTQVTGYAAAVLMEARRIGIGGCQLIRNGRVIG